MYGSVTSQVRTHTCGDKGMPAHWSWAAEVLHSRWGGRSLMMQGC